MGREGGEHGEKLIKKALKPPVEIHPLKALNPPIKFYIRRKGIYANGDITECALVLEAKVEAGTQVLSNLCLRVGVILLTEVKKTGRNY